MSERPIIFSGAMVRALLDGQKTQTRRVMKPQPDKISRDGKPIKYKQIAVVRDGCIEKVSHPDGKPDKRFVDTLRSPYGNPGDRLWVRETWLPDAPIDGWDGCWEWDGCGRQISGVPEQYRKPEHCIYAATWNGPDLCWKASIHMPRWASRITLEVVSVRVERVKDISNVDAQAEGVGWWQPVGGEKDYRLEFSMLWDRINADRGFSWASNPWVWVVEFKRVEV